VDGEECRGRPLVAPLLIIEDGHEDVVDVHIRFVGVVVRWEMDRSGQGLSKGGLVGLGDGPRDKVLEGGAQCRRVPRRICCYGIAEVGNGLRKICKKAGARFAAKRHSEGDKSQIPDDGHTLRGHRGREVNPPIGGLKVDLLEEDSAGREKSPKVQDEMHHA
jgi:hypothetical protein